MSGPYWDIDRWIYEPDEPDDEPVYGVWITLQTPSGKVTTVRACDRGWDRKGPLTFDTEAEASEYAEQRLRWYERRHQWCEVSVGEVIE